MPRKVAHLRAAVAAVALAAALCAPSAAGAASVLLTAESDPAAGIPTGLLYEYATDDNRPLDLTIVTRPATGPPCQPTQVLDASAAGSEGTTYLLTPGTQTVTGHGGERVPYTYKTPGVHRVCAWLNRAPDDPAATAGIEVEVRQPRAGLTITAQQQDALAGGSDLLVHLAGTTETAQDVFVTVVEGASCPPTFDDQTDPRPFDVVPASVATRVTGSYALDFSSTERLSYRRWTICAWLQDGSTATTAVASASQALDFVLRPAVLRKPRVKRQAGAVFCDGGRWKAKPKATFAYAWFAGTRRVPGATKARLKTGPALQGKSLRCRVTATNRLGKTSSISSAVKAR